MSIILLFPAFLSAQFEYTPKTPANESTVQPSSNFFLGFIDLNRLQMHHTFSASYMTLGNDKGMMLNSYINTINYHVSNPLFLRVNIGLMNSPYNSFTKNNPAFDSTSFFGSAELFYKPSENMMFKFGVTVAPPVNYFYSPYWY
jgi:hypothetical protein